jgi:hypothetical protein
MKKNKGWVIGCGIVGVCLLMCGGGIAGLVYFFMNTFQQLGKPTDEFLTQLGSGSTAGAYQSAASGLRSYQTPEQFAESVKKMRLDEYKSSSWNKFDVKNNQATLEGAITFKDGSTLPVVVSLVNEGGWKVLGIKSATAGGFGGNTERLTVPPDADLKKLINRDMVAFHQAVKADDFTAFHAGLSKQFQESSTAKSLKTAFQVFVEKKIDLSAVEKVDPKVTKPATIDGNGVLQVEGEYPSRPATILFTLRYVSQNKDWKLHGIDVQTKASD